MADFKKSFDLLKKWENRQTARGLIVYSNVSGDKGGETVLGVARNSHPDLAFWGDIDKLKLECGLTLQAVLKRACCRRRLIKSKN